jgi:hypothetical protein
VIGAHVWAIGDGWIPPTSNGPAPEMTSHDSFCMLNAGDETAEVDVMVYFHDREPAGPYRITIPPRRVHHQRFNDLEVPERLPLGVDYSAVIRSTAAIVVQHTRLDSRQAANALMSTIAYAVNS